MLTCPNCSTRCLEAETTVCPTCKSDLSLLVKAPPDLPQSPLPEASEKGRRMEVASSSARFEPGTLIGERYRVIDALGRGGMGEVYRADDLELGGSVALKFLPEELERDDNRLEMLLYETRIARTVSHPNVCRVHDIGSHAVGGDGGGKLHFISMEYIDGEDLASLLRRIGRLPKGKALELCLELCAGLQAVHDRGLLHCDIKPGNVMIDGLGHARITDFGLAVVGSHGATFGGTPAYMAPEQHAGRKTTVRSDVYALGLVFYEIFTGERAFRAGSALEYAWLHLQTKPTSPSELVTGLDPEIEKIIYACLETLPDRRAPSVAAIADFLSEIDPNGPTVTNRQIQQGETLRAVLLCDLVGSTALVESLGNRRAAELGRRHDRLARDLLARYEGREIDKSDGFLLLFERPIQAVRFALGYHEGLERLSSEEDRKIEARVGIHFGEVWLWENAAADVDRGAKPVEVEGLAKAVAARLMSAAEGGQTLLGRSAFDLARRAAENLDEAEELRWLDHGSWRLRGVADPVDVFEVGRENRAPLRSPEESEKARRLLMQPRIDGWRPAPGLAIPGRPNWRVQRRLGEGGFGEVWLARHRKTNEQRSFKFCFDAERLRALQREITLFRLLKEELGDRKDINRILDWNLDQAPFFIESEYSNDGSLAEWAEAEGGLGEIPLAERLEIVAQVATALAAAHSVGILHKDVKPSNILIRHEPDGSIRAQLADFGIGQVTERERLAAAGITVLGLSERSFDETASSGTGTRLYMAPELLEGQAPTLQADLYSLGVVLYQMVVGDPGRALAPGWRRDIEDELLADDIADFMDRSPERRPGSAREMAERLRNLEQRRHERQAAMAARRALDDAQRRRRIYQAVAITSFLALLVVSVLALWAIDAGRNEKQARQATDQVLGFMVDLFEITDPYGVSAPGENRGETVTAREILDRGAERIRSEFGEEPLVQAQLMATFGNIYRSLGLYRAAEPLLGMALRIRQKSLGDDPRVAESFYQMGRLLLAKGDYPQAASALNQALELQIRLTGAEHLEVAKIKRDLAGSFYYLGDLEQARRLTEGALEIQQQALGDEHPDTLRTMGNLANCLSALGISDRARQLYEQTLEIQQRILGAEHPATLRTQNGLANFFYSLGDFDRARQLYEQTLEIQQRILGAEHPSTSFTSGNLASTSILLGDFERAKEWGEQTLEIQQRVLGTEHAATLHTLSTLASSIYFLGDFERARQLGEEALEAQQRVLGTEHVHSLHTASRLAGSFCSLGDFEQARQLHEQALEIEQRALATEHPDILAALGSTIYCLYSLGDFEQARQLGERALEVQERTLGSEHHFTLSTMNDLSYSLRALGDPGRARELQEKALDSRRRSSNPENPHTFDLMTNLASTLRQAGELGEAEKLAQEAFGRLEAELGSEHFFTTRAARTLLEIAVDQGDPVTIARWTDALRWLIERDEASIMGVEQRRARGYVLEVMAELDSAGLPTATDPALVDGNEPAEPPAIDR